MVYFWICTRYRRDISEFVKSTDGIFLDLYKVPTGHFWLTQTAFLRPNTPYVIGTVPHVVSQLVEALR